MANRSHLYATDFIPPRSKGQRPPRGLNEHRTSIPLVHQLMIATEPQIVRSEIWPDHEIAVIAKRAGADERMLALYDRLLAEPFPGRDELARDVDAMRTFLAEEEKRTYVLLEPGEIYELEGSDLAPRAWMERELARSVRVNQRVDRAMAGTDDAYLATLRSEVEERATGWWSHVLYFSFPDDATG